MNATNPRGPSRLAAVVVALAAACALTACGKDDPEPIVLKAGEVVRRCTTDIYAARPFGTMQAVDRYAIEFEVPPGTTSFLLAAHDEGASTTISSMIPPSGFALDLLLDEQYKRYHPSGYGSLYGFPIDVDRFMVPPAPQFTGLMEPGLWEVRGDTGGGRFCVSIATAEQPGTQLDLAVYLVGIPGQSAATFRQNPEWIEVLTKLGSAFEAAGLTVNYPGISYVDIEGDAAIKFGVLRSYSDLSALMRESERGHDDTPLRVNVFLVRGFAGDLPTGLLGVSSGIPGVAGVHGTTDSGIVFGVGDYLGVDDIADGVSGNEYLGHVMAHELGHYVGLFHTSEIRGGVDPLDDTPFCVGIQHMNSADEVRAACDDVDNLMFPFAIPGAGTDLSPLQVTTARISPLMRVP